LVGANLGVERGLDINRALNLALVPRPRHAAGIRAAIVLGRRGTALRLLLLGVAGAGIVGRLGSRTYRRRTWSDRRVVCRSLVLQPSVAEASAVRRRGGWVVVGGGGAVVVVEGEGVVSV